MPSSLTIGYAPLPKPWLFHHSLAPTKAIFGGNGSGKTHALCQEAAKLATVNAGCGGLFLEPTYRMCRDIAVPKLKRVLRENGIAFTYSKSEFRFDLPQFGSWVWVRSADNADTLEGLDAAWAILDEAPLYTDGPAVMSACTARLRDSRARHLELAVGGTFDGWDWTSKVFDEREKPAPLGDFEWWLAPTTDNIHNPAAYVERLETNLPTEAHRKQRILGQRVDLFSGTVYVSFDRTKHVAPVELPQGGRLVHALDFNVDPACSVVGIRSGSRFLVADEIRIEGGATTDNVATEFVNRFGDWPGEVTVHGDQTSTRRDTRGTLSDFAILANAYRAHFGRRFVGCDLPSSNPLEKDRVSSVNARLRLGEVQIDPRCRWLIIDLARVTWKQGARIIDKDKDHTLTHLSDALGYWVHRVAPVTIDLPAPVQIPGIVRPVARKGRAA